MSNEINPTMKSVFMSLAPVLKMRHRNQLALMGLIVALILPGKSMALTIEELVKNHIAAIGGLSKVSALASVEIQAETSFLFQTFSIKQKIVNNSTLEETFTHGDTVMGSTTVSGGEGINREDGAQSPMNPIELKLAKRRMDLAGPLVNSAGKGISAVYKGEKNVGALGRLHEVEVLYPDQLPSAIYYLDPVSFLIVRSIEPEYDGGEKKITTSTTDYSDYREVSGVKFPFVMKNGFLSVKVKSYTIRMN